MIPSSLFYQFSQFLPRGFGHPNPVLFPFFQCAKRNTQLPGQCRLCDIPLSTKRFQLLSLSPIEKQVVIIQKLRYRHRIHFCKFLYVLNGIIIPPLLLIAGIGITGHIYASGYLSLQKSLMIPMPSKLVRDAIDHSRVCIAEIELLCFHNGMRLDKSEIMQIHGCISNCFVSMAHHNDQMSAKAVKYAPFFVQGSTIRRLISAFGRYDRIAFSTHLAA